MSKCIAYTWNGQLCVCHPAPQARMDGESEDDFIARIRAKDIPAGAADVTIVEQDALPRDRSSRREWTLDKAARRVMARRAPDAAR